MDYRDNSFQDSQLSGGVHQMNDASGLAPQTQQDRSPYEEQLRKALGVIGGQQHFDPLHPKGLTGAEGQLWQGIGQQQHMMDVGANRRGFDPGQARAASYAGGQLESQAWGMANGLRAQEEARRREMVMQAMQARSGMEGELGQTDLAGWMRDYQKRTEDAALAYQMKDAQRQSDNAVISGGMKSIESMGGGMMSDARAKREAYNAGRADQDALLRNLGKRPDASGSTLNTVASVLAPWAVGITAPMDQIDNATRERPAPRVQTLRQFPVRGAVLHLSPERQAELDAHNRARAELAAGPQTLTRVPAGVDNQFAPEPWVRGSPVTVLGEGVIRSDARVKQQALAAGASEQDATMAMLADRDAKRGSMPDNNQGATGGMWGGWDRVNAPGSAGEGVPRAELDQLAGRPVDAAAWGRDPIEDAVRAARERRVAGLVEGLRQADHRTTAALLAPGGGERQDRVAELVAGLSEAGRRTEESLRGSPAADERARQLTGALGQLGAHTDAALRSIKPVTYQYKQSALDRGERPGQRFGLMAQDLEKTPLGRTMVVNTPHGKVVDVKAATLGNMALLGRVDERLRRLEGGGTQFASDQSGPPPGERVFESDPMAADLGGPSERPAAMGLMKYNGRLYTQNSSGRMVPVDPVPPDARYENYRPPGPLGAYHVDVAEPDRQWSFLPPGGGRGVPIPVPGAYQHPLGSPRSAPFAEPGTVRELLDDPNFRFENGPLVNPMRM